MTTRRAGLTTVMLGIGGAVLIVGCTSGTPASKSGSQPKPPSKTASASMSPAASTSVSPGASMQIPCKEVNQLRTSLTSLTHTTISPDSATTLAKDLKNIQTDIAALKSKTSGSFASQLNALTASIDQIKKAAAGLSTSPAPAVKQLASGLADLKLKAKPVIAELNAACPK